MKHLDRSEMMELYDAYTQLMKIERTPRFSSRGVPCVLPDTAVRHFLYKRRG